MQMENNELAEEVYEEIPAEEIAIPAEEPIAEVVNNDAMDEPKTEQYGVDDSKSEPTFMFKPLFYDLAHSTLGQLPYSYKFGQDKIEVNQVFAFIKNERVSRATLEKFLQDIATLPYNVIHPLMDKVINEQESLFTVEYNVK